LKTKQELLSRLQQIISDQLSVQQEEITGNSTWEELGADSLDRLGMTRAFEDEFKVEIPHETGERLNTVGETLDHLWTLVAVGGEVSQIQIEEVTTSEQWNEMLGVQTRSSTLNTVS
jgi:acyl carrier protein